MRVLITLLALVTAPFLASVSQEPAGSPSRTDNDAVRHSEAGNVEDQDNDDGDRPCWTGEHDAARESHSRGHGHHWAKGHAKHACDPPAPPPPPADGVGEIDGTSYRDVNGDGFQEAGEPGLAGWTIELRNALTGAVVATGTSDGLAPPLGLGDYRFQNLAAGTYLVCEVAQTGWRQTEPVTPRPCTPFVGSLTGYGYTVTFTAPLPAGVTTSLANNFGNAPN